jgi:uncharacterized protein YodC (DUF2158 family)
MDEQASMRTHKIAIAAVLALVVSMVSPTAFAGSSVNATNGAVSPVSRKTGDLRLGATVRLNSGGPLMTVAGVQGGVANCRWATEYGEIATATFPVTALTVVGGPGWLPYYAAP